MLTVNVEAEFDPQTVAEAVSLLQRACAAEPGKLRYRLSYGEALLAARRNAEALEELRAVYDREPVARTAYLMAVALFRLGRYAEAHELMEGAREQGTVGFAKLHILRGRIYHAEGRLADAVNEFGEAMILNPHSSSARWHRARALVALAGDRDDAGALYRRAYQLLRDHRPVGAQADEYHYLLGRIHLALLYPAQALQHLERSRFPSDPEKHLLVGVAMLLTGRSGPARASLCVAASDPAMRKRVAAFLIEIASAPSDALMAMSPPGAREANGQLAADLDTLVSVFGPGAPEIETIREAARTGRVPESIRTRVENVSPVIAGRLFADFGGGDDAAPAAGSDPEATVVSRSDRTTKASPVAPDQLFPQTHVDVTKAIPRTEILEVTTPEEERPARPVDEDAQPTRTFQDFDDVPDLDFPDIEDPEADS
ncbi:MAG: tetratricopeptide repeat protein [Planctomycetota bacterium]